MINRIVFFNLILFSLIFSNENELVKSKVIAEYKTLSPNLEFLLAFQFDIEEEWHLYWLNPGDSGTPIEIEFDSTQGVTFGNLIWQYPKRFDISGLVSYGYEKSVTLFVPVKVSNLFNLNELDIKGKIKWLVCKVECLPGNSDFSIKFPIEKKSVLDIDSKAIIEKEKQYIPIVNETIKTKATSTDSSLVLNLTSNSDLPLHIKIYPKEQGIFNYKFQTLESTRNEIKIEMFFDSFKVRNPELFEAVLVAENGWRGEDSEKAIEISVPIIDNLLESTPSDNSISLIIVLLLAFAGGIILNIMPCVLPVISLKIFSFIQQSNNNKKETFLHGLFYSLGIVISFWVLAVILLLLKSSGASVGWGFQLQSPEFVAALILILFIFGLNLLGVFEIGTGLSGVENYSEGIKGKLGSFTNGILATIVATPCTAPFMGTALGYTLTQPFSVSLLVFTSLGLGLAFPYLILSAFPSAIKFLPKPGGWMIFFKQVLGFIMLGTIIWLIYIIIFQVDSFSIVLLLATLLLLAFGSWIYGKFQLEQGLRKTVNTIVYFLIILFAFYYVFTNLEKHNSNNPINVSSNGMMWKPFSNELIKELENSNQSYFIDFTAKWCITCQVNKKIALNSEKIKNAFDENDITPIIADWTNYSPLITKALENYGRNSVPFYILKLNTSNKPKILPELLTEDIIINYITN